jgi:hypothetical protein
MKSVLQIDLSGRTERRWHRLALIVTVALGLVLSLGLTVSPSRADESTPNVPASEAVNATSASTNLHACHGSVASSRQDTWGDDSSFILQFGIKPVRYDFRVTSALYYWYCPNQQYTALVMPLKTLYCYTPLDSVPVIFNGITFNSLYWSDAKIHSDPKGKHLGASNNQVCRWHAVPTTQREWMLMTDFPVQRTHFIFNLWGYPDFNDNFRYRGHIDRPINPAYDAVIYPLHKIPNVR